VDALQEVVVLKMNVCIDLSQTIWQINLQAMRYYQDVHADTKATASVRVVAIDKAAAFAKDAAPYMHPRLAAVAVMGTGNAAQYQAPILISPELENQFILISILTPRRAANFRGGYLVTIACSSSNLIG
jgi:hypothetical protein